MPSRFLSWMSDSLLAGGLLLSFETQLRPSGTGVGPGEVCLVAWELPLILSLFLRRDLVIPRACWEVLRFWTLFALALSLGMITSIVLGEILDVSLVVHDATAYLLLASLTSLMTLSLGSTRMARVEWLLVIGGSGSLLLQATNTWGWYALPNIDPWYWDRVRGWCDNPNQLALLCLLLALLALHLAECAARPGARLFAVTCGVIAVVYGWFSGSNDYHVVVLIAACMFSTVKALRCIVSPKQNVATGILLASAAVLVPLSVITPVIDDDLSGRMERIAQSLVRPDVGSDLALRERLWLEGMKCGAEAFMLGLGPGPHLPIPQIILSDRRFNNEPLYLQHPKPGVAANFETHNTLIELFVQSGMLGVASFLWLGAIALSRSFKAGHDGVLTALCSLAIFGNSGVIFRFPGVWFVISVALALDAPWHTKRSPGRSHANSLMYCKSLNMDSINAKRIPDVIAAPSARARKV